MAITSNADAAEGNRKSEGDSGTGKPPFGKRALSERKIKYITNYTNKIGNIFLKNKMRQLDPLDRVGNSLSIGTVRWLGLGLLLHPKLQSHGSRANMAHMLGLLIEAHSLLCRRIG